MIPLFLAPIDRLKAAYQATHLARAIFDRPAAPWSDLQRAQYDLPYQSILTNYLVEQVIDWWEPPREKSVSETEHAVSTGGQGVLREEQPSTVVDSKKEPNALACLLEDRASILGISLPQKVKDGHLPSLSKGTLLGVSPSTQGVGVTEFLDLILQEAASDCSDRS